MVPAPATSFLGCCALFTGSCPHPTTNFSFPRFSQVAHAARTDHKLFYPLRRRGTRSRQEAASSRTDHKLFYLLRLVVRGCANRKRTIPHRPQTLLGCCAISSSLKFLLPLKPALTTNSFAAATGPHRLACRSGLPAPTTSFFNFCAFGRTDSHARAPHPALTTSFLAAATPRQAGGLSSRAARTDHKLF
jgi:hypothetical protein